MSPITVVYSHPVSQTAKQQQQAVYARLQEIVGIHRFKVTQLSDRLMIKKNMESLLTNSNVIVIGNPKDNLFIRAMKSALIKQATATKFPWREVMNKPNLYGTYAVQHPYNQNRLVVGYFWTNNQLSQKAVKSFMTDKLFIDAHGIYQFFVKREDGSSYKQKVVKI